MTGYKLTISHLAVIVIFSKFSDIFGRKTIFLLSTLIFVVFSGGCAAAQNITQLYVLPHAGPGPPPTGSEQEALPIARPPLL